MPAEKEGTHLIALAHRHDKDMTTGSIPLHLLQFAVPLLIGNVFQQLYNTIDSIIVGNYIGKEALAAIGCSSPIINTFINFFSGLASGAGVVISNYYGAKDKDRLHRSVQTTVTLTLILCVVLTVLGVLLTPMMLRMMQTPDDVFASGAQYLQIYFGGISSLLLYNIGAGILRAVGDSTRPLYILIFCAVLNTILDIVFVQVFRWGIAGAAVATVVSQLLSAGVVFYILISAKEDYRFQPGKLMLSRRILGMICSIGLPSAIQMAITAFSNVFVQSYINRFGSSFMAGWTAYVKIDGFAMQPLNSLSVAITTFIGQNFGAGEVARVRKAPRYALALGAVIFIVCVPPLMIFAPQLVRLFNRDPEVIRHGAYFIRVISPFYVAFCINQVYTGMLRGSGDSIASMVILLFSFVVFRQIYLFTAYRLNLGVLSITLGYPVGWVMCASLLLIYYYTKGKYRTSLQK